MLEIEIKLPVRPDCTEERLEKQLEKLGFEKEYEILEKDIYLDNAAGQIRLGGSALRVRSVKNLQNGSEEACITFKGPKMDAVSMSRQELETGVEDARKALSILEALGYMPVEPSVAKRRCGYHCGRMNACLDQVEGLGFFLELEIVTEEPKQRDQAEQKDAMREKALREIEGVLEQLGYTMKDTVTNSYLSMLQGRTD